MIAAGTSVELYEALRAKSRKLALKILEESGCRLEDPQIRYLVEQSKRMANIETGHVAHSGGSAGRVLDFLSNNIAEFLRGRLSVLELRRKLIIQLGYRYWEDLMTESPMKEYADMCAQFLIDHDLLEGSTLELGAGIGNVSRKIGRIAREYIRTDKYEDLLREGYGGVCAQYDFDLPGSFRNFHTVFAANALHCAADKVVTLGYIREMLAPGGRLVLAEGQDPVQSDEPWCLNLLFGIYDGWWDHGGFLQRADWLNALHQTGFVQVEYQPLCAGSFDLGGLIWGTKP